MTRKSRYRTALIVAVCTAFLTLAWRLPYAAADQPSPTSSSLSVAYQFPLHTPTQRVLREFEKPPTEYAAGHRGVDLAASENTPVLAAGAGSVTFAGRVAGRGVVVLLHADGVRTTYEPLTPSVSKGEALSGGAKLGVINSLHTGCETHCLHWGARVEGGYLNPLLLLQQIRLLPIGGR